jgi:hypothetical protein
LYQRKVAITDYVIHCSEKKLENDIITAFVYHTVECHHSCSSADFFHKIEEKFSDSLLAQKLHWKNSKLLQLQHDPTPYQS